MNRRQFMKYVDHFNHHRWDKVTGYFTPDVALINGVGAQHSIRKTGSHLD